MAANEVSDSRQAVTVSLTVSPCSEAIDFYVRAFGAALVEPPMIGPDGRVAHAEIRIGDTVIMLGDEWADGPTQSPHTLGGSTSAVFLYVDDVDTLWDQAMSAGAEVVFPLEMQFYGDKGGRCARSVRSHLGVGTTRRGREP